MSSVTKPNLARGKTVAVVVTVIGLAGLLIWLVSGLLGGQTERAKKPPKINLVAAPPPPPPPPKFEKKPDPPKEQKEMKVDQPQQAPKEAPPQSPELKMDGPAGDGPSAFAAGNITSEDLSKFGNGKPGGVGGMFDPVANYDNLLKGELQRYLTKQNALRKRRYAIELHVWVSGSGALKRFELIGNTGDSDTDDAIRQALAGWRTFSEAPPANMPQPTRLRVVVGS